MTFGKYRKKTTGAPEIKPKYAGYQDDRLESETGISYYSPPFL